MTRHLAFDDVLRQAARGRLAHPRRRTARLGTGAPVDERLRRGRLPRLWSKAAALCQSLDSNQALVDSYKRLAGLTTKVFLALNGQQLRASADDGERFMLDLVSGHADVTTLAAWLEAHCIEQQRPESPDMPTACRRRVGHDVMSKVTSESRSRTRSRRTCWPVAGSTGPVRL